MKQYFCREEQAIVWDDFTDQHIGPSLPKLFFEHHLPDESSDVLRNKTNGDIYQACH